MEQWIIEWVEARAEQKIRQEEYDRVSGDLVHRVVEADQKVAELREAIKQEYGIDPQVYLQALLKRLTSGTPIADLES